MPRRGVTGQCSSSSACAWGLSHPAHATQYDKSWKGSRLPTERQSANPKSHRQCSSSSFLGPRQHPLFIIRHASAISTFTTARLEFLNLTVYTKAGCTRCASSSAQLRYLLSPVVPATAASPANSKSHKGSVHQTRTTFQYFFSGMPQPHQLFQIDRTGTSI